MKERFLAGFATACMSLLLLGCGASDSTDASITDSGITVCPGASPASVITPESCDVVAEEAFLSEHFKWVSISGANGDDYWFNRISSFKGIIEVAEYSYDSILDTYIFRPPPTVWGTSTMVQSSSGEWIRFQIKWLHNAVAEPVALSSGTNEYPVRISSPDDPGFELLVHFKDIIEADISGLDFTEVRFNPVYTGGVSGIYPAESKAYSAKFVFTAPVNLRYYQATEATVYPSLQAFTDAYSSQWFCLRNGYGVRFDAAINQSSMVKADLISEVCVPEVGASPFFVDLSTQIFNNVTFLTLSGENLPDNVSTSFGTTGEYSILLTVADNVVEMGYRLPSGTTFTYRPGAGAYLNRTALNFMLSSVGRPDAP